MTDLELRKRASEIVAQFRDKTISDEEIIRQIKEGISYYDRKILERVIEASGITKETMERADEGAHIRFGGQDILKEIQRSIMGKVPVILYCMNVADVKSCNGYCLQNVLK